MNNKITKLASTAAVALSLNAAPAIAQTSTFLQLTDIQGEATDSNFKGQIDVLAWSWGLSQSGSLHFGGGGGAGKTSFQDVAITKFTDSASPRLYERLVTGKFISEGTISVTVNNGKGAEVITELKMRPVLVTSASTGGSGSEVRTAENISLNFESFCLKQNSIQFDGTIKQGQPFCWDIAKNAATSPF